VVDVQRSLGLPTDATHAAVARALVGRVMAADLEQLHASRVPPSEAPAETLRVRNLLDTSFLGQLSLGDSASLSLSELDDTRTLLGVLRAGSLAQRRAAAARLVVVLRERATVADATEIAHAIADIREPALERALRDLRAELPDAREHGDDGAALGALVARLERDIEAYWDGELRDEPVAALPTDQRLLLFHRLTDVSGAVLRPIAAVL